MVTRRPTTAKLAPAASLASLLAAILYAILGSKSKTGFAGLTGQQIAAYAATALAALHAPPLAKAAKRKAKPKKRTPKVPPPPWFGIDWAWGSISPKALHTIGARFACRYLSLDPSKNLQPAESHALHRAGLKRVVVWETTANRATAGQAAGAEDANRALEQAHACGLDRTWNEWAIYFAIDFDAAGPDVEGYFRGAHSVLGKHAGAYGGIRSVRYLLDKGLIGYAWQTYAWSGGQWEKRAHLIQFSNGHVVAGVQVDFDRALQPGYGGW